MNLVTVVQVRNSKNAVELYNIKAKNIATDAIEIDVIIIFFFE